MQRLKEWFKFLKTRNGVKYLAVGLIGLWLVSGLLMPAVEVTPVRRGTALDAITGTLRVQAAQEITLKTLTGGRVAAVSISKDPLHQLLADGEQFGQLDTAQIDREIDLYKRQQQLLKKKIEVGSPTELEIINARKDMNVIEALYKSGQYAQADLEKRRNDLEKLERVWSNEQMDIQAELAKVEYELATRLGQREQMLFKSPMKGLLTEVYVIVGQTLLPDADVAKVRTPELVMEVSLAEEDFIGLQVGNRAVLNFSGVGGNFKGHVLSLMPTSNADTHRRSVLVALEEPNDLLVPGTTGYATLIKAERPKALLIPRRALIGGDKVYVEAFGVLYPRHVRVGYQSFNQVEILSGLFPWERVALTGATPLMGFMRVQTKEVK